MCRSSVAVKECYLVNKATEHIPGGRGLNGALLLLIKNLLLESYMEHKVPLPL